MILRTATRADIECLAGLRNAFVEEEWGLKADWDRNVLADRIRTYVDRHLGHDLFAVLAEIGNEAVATAFLVVSERPAHPVFPTGRSGLLLNVYTRPEHRRKGYATAVIRLLLDVAREQQVCRVDLSATPDGMPVYERLGFAPSSLPSMNLHLDPL